MVKLSVTLYATGTTTADAVASSIVPVSGVITAASWSWYGSTTGAGGGGYYCELSGQSTRQSTTSDARNIIDILAATSDCVTTTIACGGNKNSIVPAFRVNAGDKVYLHRLSYVAMGAFIVNVTYFIT